ncbi:MAG: hypothetical protein QX198_07775 [Methylococcaceae bacterium]
MLHFITQWWRQRRTDPKQTLQPHHSSGYASKLTEHIYLHLHISDLTKMPPELNWHAKNTLVMDSVKAESLVRSPVPYDEHLLDNARTQWQFGDWDSLMQLQLDTIEQHPERAKLALLAAAGHQQAGDMTVAREFIKMAQEWGCDKNLLSRVLVAGVYNTLGKAAAIEGQQDKALDLFGESVRLSVPNGSHRLIMQARTTEQLAQLGLKTGEFKL